MIGRNQPRPIERRRAVKATILIIEDERLLSNSLKKALAKTGYSVLTEATGKDGLELLGESSPDLVLLDVRLPDTDGMEVLRIINKMDNPPPVIIMTAFSGIKGAVESIKLGAYDYIAKPFDVEELKFIIQRCLESQKAVAEVKNIISSRKERYSFDNILTSNLRMKKLVDLTKRVALNSQSTILLLGESGTGKELFANAIHYNGPRADQPLITINCAAFSEGILESELFGHEKGAFTGAIRQKKGIFELADKGTLFLDEIGEVSPKTQVKLLRFLEDKHFQRVGGTRSLEVDVRIIAATNRNLLRDVKEGRFREDLYYRLNVVTLSIPPLRERKDDIPLLVDHFIKDYSRILNKEVRACDSEALDILTNYSWPGNIRELKNIIERGVLLNVDSMIKPSDIPIEINGHPVRSDIAKMATLEPMRLDRLIRLYAESILSRLKNNRSRTAESLGITRQRLRRILKSQPLD
jgi:DNA-binding NtrC family response regulator